MAANICKACSGWNGQHYPGCLLDALQPVTQPEAPAGVGVYALEMLAVVRAAGLEVLDRHLVGSVAVLGAGRDIDLLVRIMPRPPAQPIYTLTFEGWSYGGSAQGPDALDKWGSWTSRAADGQPLNLIITDNADFFTKWVTATRLCRAMHVHGLTVDKRLRVGVHQIVVDGRIDFDVKGIQ